MLFRSQGRDAGIRIILQFTVYCCGELNSELVRAIGEKLFANSGKKRYNEFEVKKDVKH